MAISLQTIALAAGTVFTMLFFLYRRALPTPIAGIPYNVEATRNLLGDVPAFKKWYQKRPEMFSFLADQCVKLDSPVIQLFLRPFAKPWIVIADFRESQDIMTRRTHEFDRSSFFEELSGALIPHVMAYMPTTQEWRVRRKFLDGTMSGSFLNDVAGPRMYSNTLDVMDLWSEKARLSKGRPFSVIEDVYREALDIIWAMAFGSEIGTSKSQTMLLSKLAQIDLPDNTDCAVDFPTASLPAAFKSIMKLSGSCEIALRSPFPRWYHRFVLTFYPSLIFAQRHRNKLIKERLDAAWEKFSAEGEASEITSTADFIVHREVSMAKKEGRTPQYDTEDIRNELFGYLIAGHETCASTMGWGLKFLADNPQTQRKIRAELRSRFSVAYDEHRNPSIEEITKADLSYLEAAIQEIHRCGTVSPGNFRVATRDTQILGFPVPKGTQVFMLTCGPGYLSTPFQIDEENRSNTSTKLKGRHGVWETHDSGVFKPERWLYENEEGKVVLNGRAGPSQPFGAGPRSCFGRKVANLELRIFFALTVWKFELKPAPLKLSGYIGKDAMTHKPVQCYIRLADAP